MPKIRLLLFCIILWSSLFSEDNRSNALINEHSVYLQQHAHNPVHWYPWGEAAFMKAKKENKLIFLSIGYSTCHWCHIMEEESFTDKDIAEELNKHFISIKVDREEYPQIDKKYQQLYMKVFGKRGGWPLSVFLSSNKEAFFIGTYIPKERGYGSKGLENLLPSFIALQNEPRSFQNAIIKYKKIHATRKLKRKHDMQLSDTLKTIEKQFDAYNGGFSTRPKFPESSKINLLLEVYQLEHNQKALYMAGHTLTKMAEGGIYDQIGGGFFRYTTDYAWQIPHFEKMLYTNAELISVYAKATMLTGKKLYKKLYKKIVDESIEQMEKNYMRGGLYLSASDADSDGEEGGYYIYEYIEVKSALKYKGWSTQEIDEALAYMGIEENGNIDGDFSLPHICTTQVPKKLEALKAYLHVQSNQRTFPFVDTKIITAWNAMMIKSLFIASPLDTKYLELAQKRLTKLLEVMRPKNILYHQTLLGHDATQKALLEDYAFLVDTLIVGYEYTYEVRYLSLAMTLTEEALRKFYRKRLWYLSDDGIEVEADFDDRYYTAALSVMLDNLLRLGTLKELPIYHKIVEESISTMGGVLDTAPQNASKLVSVYLRLKYQDILIHASKKKLLRGQKEIQSIDYPFVLSQTQESDAYLACKGTTCFAYDKNISKLIEKIKEVQ